MKPIWTAAFLLLLGSTLTAPLGAATFTVGADGACTHGDLPNALLSSFLNGPGVDTIRLARNTTYSGEYVIDNQSVILEGGYDTCSDTTPTNRTDVNRAMSQRNFRISGTVNPNRVVTLIDINVRRTGPSGTQAEGGAIQVLDGHTLILDNTDVGDGRANVGGGIFLDGAHLVMINGASVVGNTAVVNGGGIACENGGSVGLNFFATIAFNDADFGGGVYLTSNCTLNHLSTGPFTGINDNSAVVQGGGVFAGGGSTVNVAGGEFFPATVARNDAEDGAGLFVTGAGTQAFIDDSHVTDNDATLSGGGLFVANGATLTMDRTLDDCHSTLNCSDLSRNTAAGPNAFQGGAALFVGVNASATIRQTRIDGNLGARSQIGVIIDGSLTVEGALITNNESRSGFIAFGTSPTVHLSYITMGDNIHHPPSGWTGLITDISSSGSMSVLSSVLSDADSLANLFGEGSGSTGTFDCLIVESDFLMTNATNWQIVDPFYVDPASGDYTLRVGSPAVDYCDDFFTAGAGDDLYGQPRGIDAPQHPNAPLGPFDLGAFEMQFLFTDGFESGDTSAWTSSVP